MDSTTAFAIAVLMILLNGAVLGLMHTTMPHAMQPSARSWRIATLLMAGGSALLAVQRFAAPGLVYPLANGLLLSGMALYWRALRQFNAQPDHWLMLLPIALGMLATFWYAHGAPDVLMRVMLASACWLVLIGGCVHALLRPRQALPISHRVLLGLFSAVAVLLCSRLGWIIWARPQAAAAVDPNGAINAITLLIVVLLPVIGTTAFLQMCSERIRRQWEHAASTDHLTGLANRRTLAEEGERRLQDAAASSALAVAVVDIDHFKAVNDRLGHESGDRALRHVAEQLRASCAASDLPARQGGEEFVVLINADDAEAVRVCGERLRAKVEATPLILPDGLLSMTVSVGLALRHETDKTLDDLLRRADRALYQAKHAGRNRVICDVGQ